MESLQKKIQILFNLYKLKKLSEAEILNRELLSAHPKEAFLYNTLGLILTDQKKIDEAIKYYEQGITIKPDYGMIYNNLGTIYKSKKNSSRSKVRAKSPKRGNHPRLNQKKNSARKKVRSNRFKNGEVK